MYHNNIVLLCAISIYYKVFSGFVMIAFYFCHLMY